MSSLKEQAFLPQFFDVKVLTKGPVKTGKLLTVNLIKNWKIPASNRNSIQESNVFLFSP